MRTLLFATAAVFLPIAANAGCVTGAIVGGVAGHMVGHGGLGAAGGCVVGHEHKKNAEAKAAQQANNAKKPMPGDGSSNN